MISLTSEQLGKIQAAVKEKFNCFKRIEISGYASRICRCGAKYVKATVFSHPEGIEMPEGKQAIEICPGCAKIAR